MGKQDLHCPFCGGYDTIFTGSGMIECQNCGASHTEKMWNKRQSPFDNAKQWRIIMEKVKTGSSNPPELRSELPEAYYGQPPGNTIIRNFPIYCRTTKERATVFDNKAIVVEMISDFRRLGYPCHAEPPIVVSY